MRIRHRIELIVAAVAASASAGCSWQSVAEEPGATEVASELREAQALRDEGDDEAANTLLRVTRLRRPDDFGIALALARALAEEEPDEAVFHFSAALALRPDDFDVWRELANTFAAELGDTARARELLRAASVRWPKDGRPIVAIGIVERTDGDDDKAFESFRRAIEVDPELADAHGRIAELLAKRGDHEAACEAARRAVELAPDEQQFQIALLRALHELGEHAELIERCLPATRIGVKAAPVLLATGLRNCSTEGVASVVDGVAANPQNDVYEWLFLAMSQHRLGASNVGRDWHARAVDWAAREDTEITDALARLFSTTIRFLDSESGAPADR